MLRTRSTALRPRTKLPTARRILSVLRPMKARRLMVPGTSGCVRTISTCRRSCQAAANDGEHRAGGHLGRRSASSFTTCL